MPDSDHHLAAGQPDLTRYRRSDRKRGSAVADTTRALREAIFDRVLPPGQWLREESLAETLGISRTPLREALNRIEEEGLIVREPGQGARVTVLTSEDMVVVYQVRGSLESLAASMAAKNAPLEDRERLAELDGLMSEAAEAGRNSDFHDLNIEFHRTLGESATNFYLRRMLGTVETAIRLFGTRTYTVERMREIVGEHRRITEAIVAQDAEAAAAASVDHADRARRATLERLLES
ncbi:GntR family transcriptional regulator [Leucobacter sp. Psy1]|uniref:GntR family transcriptional regulator n=1 Tax=Leucobacter sp. Psy1 TaxID=2875729 RepID=UPI001CD77B57|nr:GntR family transcriptional regulator [Leucobacter sp. Psy1]UBH07416.1 GntR family transcriptional regulator [Leucobacter sp. Psy1]